jgi:hypothetical protein
MKPCVFLGPTLSVQQASAVLDAVYLPPVAQGDVRRVTRYMPKAIGIIDGYFDQVAAVWHKEILWAMAQGIHVYGSASMGALRATELAPFGMQGVGMIYESFSSGALEDDDEVAVSHGQTDAGYKLLSEPMVNIRATLARAEQEGVASPQTLSTLTALAKSLHYRDRSYPMLLQKAEESAVSPAEVAQIRQWLPHRMVNQKQIDAVEMLRRMSEEVTETVAPKHVNYVLEETDFWREAMEARTEQVTSQSSSEEEELKSLLLGNSILSDESVIEEARLQGGSYLQARDQALLRAFAIVEHEQHGYGRVNQATGAQISELRSRLGLEGQQDFDAWIEQNHLDQSEFASLAKAEALLNTLRSTRGFDQEVLHQLRLTSRYTFYFGRAADKEQRLKNAGLNCPTLDSVHLTREALLQWYFDRLGPFFAPDARRHAWRFGFSSEEQFVNAVLREYCYTRLQLEENP